MIVIVLVREFSSSSRFKLQAGLVSLEQVKDVMKDIMSDLQQTNSEKILLSWVRQSTRPYSQVNVLNFTTSWTDGLAFNAVLHRHKCDATLLRCEDLYKFVPLSVPPFSLLLKAPPVTTSLLSAPALPKHKKKSYLGRNLLIIPLFPWDLSAIVQSPWFLLHISKLKQVT